MTSTTPIIALFIILLGGCGGSDDDAKNTNAATPIVSASAIGWSIKPGPPMNDKSPYPTTIVINPKGEEFNIGATTYPDIVPAILWIIEVEELDARFLLIKIAPIASASVTMPIVYLDEHDQAHLAGEIRQHWEFGVHPDDGPGFGPIVWRDGEHDLRDLLFTDRNDDSVPELEERDSRAWGYVLTHYHFTDDLTFVPLRTELRVEGCDYASEVRIPDAGSYELYGLNSCRPVLRNAWDYLPACDKDAINHYFMITLGTYAKGGDVLVGDYRSMNIPDFCDPDDHLLHFVQRDLFGGRLFWSCLINLTNGKAKVLYHSSDMPLDTPEFTHWRRDDME